MIKYIIVGKKWFDKVNGNTYHSARVYDLEKKVVAVASFRYGYGDQFVQSAFEAMKERGIITTDKLNFDEYIAFSDSNCKNSDVKWFGKNNI